jgi:hypothetical protein
MSHHLNQFFWNLIVTYRCSSYTWRLFENPPHTVQPVQQKRDKLLVSTLSTCVQTHSANDEPKDQRFTNKIHSDHSTCQNEPCCCTQIPLHPCKMFTFTCWNSLSETANLKLKTCNFMPWSPMQDAYGIFKGNIHTIDLIQFLFNEHSAFSFFVPP